MDSIDFGPESRWNKPVASERNPRDARLIVLHGFLPAREIHRPRIRRQHHELREREFCPFCDVCCRGKGLCAIAGQPEDKRSQHMDAILTEGPKTLDKVFSGTVKVFITSFKPCGVTASTPTNAPRMCAAFM